LLFVTWIIIQIEKPIASEAVNSDAIVAIIDIFIFSLNV